MRQPEQDWGRFPQRGAALAILGNFGMLFPDFLDTGGLTELTEDAAAGKNP